MADAPVAPTETDLDDIQGLLYSAYKDHALAVFLFASLGKDVDKGRKWITALWPQVTTASRHKRPGHGRLQIALAPSGLAKLGVPQSLLDALPQEAKDGMASRRRVLRDDDHSEWALGPALDVVVMVYAHDVERRDAMVRVQREALEAAGATIVATELTSGMPETNGAGHEHFGFADGLAQPFLPGPFGHTHRGQKTVDAGEILLGYKNAYGKLPASPTWNGKDFGRNGSYLVFRKLEQRVPLLWQWIAQQARSLADGNASEEQRLVDYLGAKIMGRWRSGASLAQTPQHDNAQYATRDQVENFGYLDRDPDGMGCPITSHVRRANPRDARGGDAKDSEKVVMRHRILRRGRSYGPPIADRMVDDGVSRGLYFICLQASIARGFEFIQQSWLGNFGFHGLSYELDPIMGNGDGTGSVTIPASPYRHRLTNVPDVIKVLGGGYFLLPSISALQMLAS